MNDPVTYGIIGAAMEAHSVLGPGFLEAIYHDAMEREFLSRGIPYVREPEVLVIYKGEPLAHFYKPDFVCHGNVVVELKAIREVGPVEDAQVLNYLKASQKPKGLLFNFGEPRLSMRRYVNGPQASVPSVTSVVPKESAEEETEDLPTNA